MSNPGPLYIPVPRQGPTVRNDFTESMQLDEAMRRLSGGGGESASGVHVTPDSAMRCATVYACVRVLAESLAQSLPNVYRVGANGLRTADRAHWAYGLLHDAPNEVQTAVEFWETLMAHLCLRGNAYVFKNALTSGPRKGQILELLILHPDGMQVRLNPDLTLSYRYTPPAYASWWSGGVAAPSRPVEYRADQVWHIRGLSCDGYMGLNPIRAMREAVGLAKATEAHGSRLFKNGPRPGLVVTHPKTLSDNAAKNIRDSIEEQTTGGNQHRPLLLEEDMKPFVLGMTSEDAQFLETRKYQRNEIASLFRVPPHMIGDLERATFSNIEHQSLEFVNRTMMPWFVRLQSSAHKNLLADAERADFAIRFDATALLQGDTLSRYQAHNLSVLGGWGTRNEARVAENRNPIQGLDEPIAPVNMVTGNPPPASPPTPNDQQQQ